MTIADASALDLTAEMTLEAWVNPSALTGWRTILIKETASDLAYALYASDGSRPALVSNVSQKEYGFGSTALPLNTWSHVAGTYDGITLRLFVNGAQAGSVSASGPVETSTAPLRLGGNNVWGEYFAGLMDEVRVYNRALSIDDIWADMHTPIQGVLPPTPPTNLRIVR